jgi:hypothetical protein
MTIQLANNYDVILRKEAVSNDDDAGISGTIRDGRSVQGVSLQKTVAGRIYLTEVRAHRTLQHKKPQQVSMQSLRTSNDGNRRNGHGKDPDAAGQVVCGDISCRGRQTRIKRNGSAEKNRKIPWKMSSVKVNLY